MKNYAFPLILSIVILLAASCGLLQPPAPQPQLSATDIPPRVTAMSELPPTWTSAPTLTPSPTNPSSPTPLPTQDPDNYQIGLVMTPAVVEYPQNTADRAGWKKMEGKTASMEIPPSYEVLDFAGVFIELMFGVMEAFAQGFSEMAAGLGEELGATPAADLETPDLGEMPQVDFLLAIEENSKSAIILASVEITAETTTEDLLNQALTDTDADFTPQAREAYLNAPYPMERVILDVDDEELGPGKQVIYVILGDQQGWNLVFTTPQDVFNQNLPLFESVIHSFSEID